MKIEVNLTKRYFFGILAGLLIIAGVLAVFAYTQQVPNPGHGGDKVLVNIPGVGGMTLQDALDQGKIGLGTSVSSEIVCSTTGAAWKYCDLGSTSEWKACFLTEHNPTTSSGSWDAGCKIDSNSTIWRLGVQAGALDGLECAARCVK